MCGLTTRMLPAVLTFFVGVTLTPTAARPASGRAPDAVPVKAEGVSDVGRAMQCAEPSAWCVIISFEGQDLGRLDRQSSAELQRAIDSLGGGGDSFGFRLIPRLISQLSNARGEWRYVLVEESPLLSVPGESRLRIHVFDAQGRTLGASDFAAGWRIHLTGVKRTHVPELDRDILEVGSQASINGRDVARQFYALVGEEVVPVRLEDSKGTPVGNIYSAPNFTIGPRPAERTGEEWERVLESDDPAALLSALMWVGGEHMDVKKPLPWDGVEEMKEARLAEAVRARPGVRELLRRLADSDNRWVREAAGAAASAGAEH